MRDGNELCGTNYLMWMQGEMSDPILGKSAPELPAPGGGWDTASTSISHSPCWAKPTCPAGRREDRCSLPVRETWDVFRGVGPSLPAAVPRSVESRKQLPAWARHGSAAAVPQPLPLPSWWPNFLLSPAPPTPTSTAVYSLWNDGTGGP